MKSLTTLPFSQGRLLDTKLTAQMLPAARASADRCERRRIFSGFTPADEGRSRVFIAECVDAEDAEFIVKACNSYDALREQVEELKTSGLVMLEHEAKRTRECLELRDQVQQLQRDMEGLLKAGNVLAEDIVHKQGVQDQLVAALKDAKALLDACDMANGETYEIIDAALAAAGAA